MRFTRAAMKTFFKILIAFGLTLGAGEAGALISSSSDPSWYAALAKPVVTPPSWLFAPVWTVLYILLAISLIRIWDAKEGEDRQRWLCAFFAQLVLNLLWSLLFFGLHSLVWGWICILILWFVVLILFVGAHQLDRRTAALLSPYLAWVTFAGILNLWIWYLN
jgi:benzodiazapine receptor